MKRITLVLSLLMVIGITSAFAQGGGQARGQRQSPEELAKTRADLFQEKFGLSDEQHKSLYTLLVKNQKESREKMSELRASGDREKMRTAMEESRADLEKEMKTIFNENQWVLYEKWKEENPPMQGRRRGGGN
mgnify:CR=1 FL=1